MSIGENIRRIRKEKGLTQKKLGELCGIAESNIRKYETGKQNPKIETVDRIARALDVHIVDIMDDYTFEEYKQTSAYQDDLKDDSARQGVISLLSNIYEKVEAKKTEIRKGVSVSYFVISGDEKKYILHYADIIKLQEYIENSIPFIVDLMIDTQTEEAMLDPYYKDCNYCDPRDVLVIDKRVFTNQINKNDCEQD